MRPRESSVWVEAHQGEELRVLEWLEELAPQVGGEIHGSLNSVCEVQLQAVGSDGFDRDQTRLRSFHSHDPTSVATLEPGHCDSQRSQLVGQCRVVLRVLPSAAQLPWRRCAPRHRKPPQRPPGTERPARHNRPPADPVGRASLAWGGLKRLFMGARADAGGPPARAESTMTWHRETLHRLAGDTPSHPGALRTGRSAANLEARCSLCDAATRDVPLPVIPTPPLSWDSVGGGADCRHELPPPGPPRR